MALTRDLQSRRAIVFKGFLFLVLGLLSSALLLLEYFSWRHAALLGLAVWSFSRAYYFAFYVIEKYVDGQFRYSGLFDFLRYLFSGRRPRP